MIRRGARNGATYNRPMDYILDFYRLPKNGTPGSKMWVKETTAKKG